jgi:hypothetical protein
MALGLIPLAVYWRHSAFLHQKPTLGRTDVGPEPEQPPPALEPEPLFHHELR